MAAAKAVLTIFTASGLLAYPSFSQAEAPKSPTKAENEKGPVRFDELALFLTINSDTPVADVLEAMMPEEDYQAVDAFELKNGVDIEDVPMSAGPVKNGNIIYLGNKIEIRPNRVVNIGGTLYKYDSMKTPFQNWQTLYTAMKQLPNRSKSTATRESSQWLSVALNALLGTLAFGDDCDESRYYCKDIPGAGNFWSNAWNDLAADAEYVGQGIVNAGHELAAAVASGVSATFHPAIVGIHDLVKNSGMNDVVCYHGGYGIVRENSNGKEVTLPISTSNL